MSQTILVTGGAGYIGSHTCVELLGASHEVVIVDNFCNAKPAAVDRIAEIAGRRPHLVRADVCDEAALDTIFAAHRIDAVIHFAGLKAVGESVAHPLLYYRNNVEGSLALLRSMQRAGCKRLVFSSSATVYGVGGVLREGDAIQPVSPYGSSKAMVERVLMDLAQSDADWHIAMLRYFNPVGAHASGRIGEDPNGIPNNLMPFIAQVAVGKRSMLTVHGDDYDTRDGTGERDYIHVVDLARGHLAALQAIGSLQGAVGINLGSGRGTTVVEMIRAFEAASGQSIPYQIGPRRAGDLPSYYADAAMAAARLGWRTELGIDAMCADTWRWQKNNPQGYPDPLS